MLDEEGEAEDHGQEKDIVPCEDDLIFRRFHAVHYNLCWRYCKGKMREVPIVSAC